MNSLSKASKNSHNDILQQLKTELIHLKQKFGMGQELKLEWMPNNGPKSGEVTGGTIHIYEADEAKALNTLQHEFIEYLLMNELVAPYKGLVNKLISLFEEEMYKRKETLVEKLLEASLCADTTRSLQVWRSKEISEGRAKNDSCSRK